MSIYHNDAKTIVIDHVKRLGFFSMPMQHYHSEYELYYLLSGERYYFVHDRTFRVRAGDFVFIHKEELHNTIDTDVPDHERIVINFDQSLLDQFHTIGPSGAITLSPQEHYRAEQLILQLLNEAKKNQLDRELMLDILLKQLLVLIFRAQREVPVVQVQPSSIHQTISKIASYINQHFNEPLKLKDVAEQFYISPFYLSRKFKECTGFGYAEYIQLVRMREAQKLLRVTDLKIIDIAEQIGMDSLANFHKLFKQTYQLSPLQFRKKEHKEQ